MTGLKTDPKLLSALKVAASHPTSPEELRKQRVSFVMGSLGEKNTLTRAKVSQALDAQQGERKVK